GRRRERVFDRRRLPFVAAGRGGRLADQAGQERRVARQHQQALAPDRERVLESVEDLLVELADELQPAAAHAVGGRGGEAQDQHLVVAADPVLRPGPGELLRGLARLGTGQREAGLGRDRAVVVGDVALQEALAHLLRRRVRRPAEDVPQPLRGGPAALLL